MGVYVYSPCGIRVYTDHRHRFYSRINYLSDLKIMEQNFFSIGHGTRQIEEFMSLLLKNGITYLLDVRSYPYSRFNPQFNQNALKLSLEEQDIRYVFMGDTLGARPKDPLCYGEDGKIRYEVLQTRDYFKEGILRLRSACEKALPVAIMCSERKPQDCHRSKLIGKVLLKSGINTQHIDELGEIKEQHELEKQFPKSFSAGL
jgi:uncharacterized protein (DUF488 family)